MNIAAHLERVAPAPPSRSAAKGRDRYSSVRVVVLLLSMNYATAKNQSLWRRIGKSYAQVDTFSVSSITSIAARFTLVEFIGSLNPSEVTLITILTCVRVTSNNLNQVERYGNETVTLKCELFLDNPCKASKESGHETTENGCSGVKTTGGKHHSLRDLMTQNSSCAVLGARLPRLSGGMGRNIRGAKKAPSELVRTGGASLCHPARGVVKAIPEIRIVEWVPVASRPDAHGKLRRCGQIFRGGSMPTTKTGQPLNVVATFRG